MYVTYGRFLQKNFFLILCRLTRYIPYNIKIDYKIYKALKIKAILILSTDIFSKPNGVVEGKQLPPEISLEWSDLKVSFRIVNVDKDFENCSDQKCHYEIFPNLDSSAPSARNIAYMRRKANKEKNNGSTLSSFLGYPASRVLPPKVSMILASIVISMGAKIS